MKITLNTIVGYFVSELENRKKISGFTKGEIPFFSDFVRYDNNLYNHLNAENPLIFIFDSNLSLLLIRSCNQGLY